MIDIYLPENLDIDKLIFRNKPNFQNPKFKKEKLLYILHILGTAYFYKKDMLYNGYVAINAQKLQGRVHDYNKYLKYLIDDLKIVECDDFWIKDIKSLGYRFIDGYNTRLAKETIDYFTLSKNINKARIQKSKSASSIGYLNKWFNKNLAIDRELSEWYLNEVYKLKRDNVKLKDRKTIYKNGKFKDVSIDIQKQYNFGYLHTDKIACKNFYLFQDKNVYRYHSNLTTMPSILRNALNYNGEELVSIDLKNSQPYLSTILFSRSFWIESSENKLSFSKNPFNSNDIKNDIKMGSRTFHSNIYTNNTNNISISSINNNRNNSYIKLVDYTKGFDYQCFNKYIKLVTNGEFYEYLEKEFLKKLGYRVSSRKDIKKAVFQVFFTDNRYIGTPDARHKRLFSELFPEVYSIFKNIKKGDKTVLARLLQNIESYLFIDVIAKRIAKELPDAPIYTIHDSIATTKSNALRVKHIIEEELTNAIGYKPTLKTEYWNKSEMYKALSKLKERAKIYA